MLNRWGLHYFVYTLVPVCSNAGLSVVMSLFLCGLLQVELLKLRQEHLPPSVRRTQRAFHLLLRELLNIITMTTFISIQVFMVVIDYYEWLSWSSLYYSYRFVHSLILLHMLVSLLMYWNIKHVFYIDCIWIWTPVCGLDAESAVSQVIRVQFRLSITGHQQHSRYHLHVCLMSFRKANI